MTKLVNSLLYIAKYDANETKILLKKINLSNIISSICLQYEPLIYENNKKLITNIDNNITIMGDEDKIKQLLNILMDNALKYSLNNGIIKISLKKNKQSNVYITVSNSSETINKEQLNKIFDRFLRLDNSLRRLNEGSGIGLSIVKSMVEVHGGSISVNSILNQGSVFEVKLPNTLLDNSIMNIYKFNEANTEIELSDIYN